MADQTQDVRPSASANQQHSRNLCHLRDRPLWRRAESLKVESFYYLLFFFLFFIFNILFYFILLLTSNF